MARTTTRHLNQRLGSWIERITIRPGDGGRREEPARPAPAALTRIRRKALRSTPLRRLSGRTTQQSAAIDGILRVELIVAMAAVGFVIGCEGGDKKATVSSVEQALSARVAAPVPLPAPTPAPAPSAEPPKIETPAWVDQYAEALCKRVALCREKMLSAVPEQQKMMLSMQIPTQEACLKNTRTFKDKAPKAELDDAEKRALSSCLRDVPKMACGNVQTGKTPECQPIAALIAEAQGSSSGAGAPPR